MGNTARDECYENASGQDVREQAERDTTGAWKLARPIHSDTDAIANPSTAPIAPSAAASAARIR